MTSTALMYVIQKSIKSTKKDNSVCPILMIKGKNTLQESWLWANQQLVKRAQNKNIESKRFSKKQNVSLD